MRRARAWTANAPESGTEASRMRTIRATRKCWELFYSTAIRRDRAFTMKDTRLQAQLDAELVTLDQQLSGLEAQLARLDRQCNQEGQK